MHYEIHVTVNTDDVATFKTDCQEIGVKPILIETEKAGCYNKQVMTSSKHSGENCLETLSNITSLLYDKGYNVLREKVEIYPDEIKHPNFLYYESHLRLRLPKKF